MLHEIITKSLKNVTKSIFPASIVSATVAVPSSKQIVVNSTHTFENFEKVHVFGFGKAVLAMAEQVYQDFADKSIPLGFFELVVPIGIQFNNPELKSKIQVHYGAANNLPDEAAFAGTLKILNTMRYQVSPKDLVIILVSGGGSALSCCPIENVTVAQKNSMTKRLASQGATIQELNHVRKCFSKVKGGRILNYLPPGNRPFYFELV